MKRLAFVVVWCVACGGGTASTEAPSTTTPACTGGHEATPAASSPPPATAETAIEEPPARPAPLPDEFVACSRDEDCVTLSLSCCTPCSYLAVRRDRANDPRFHEAFEEQRRCVMVDCAESGCSGSHGGQCENGRCAAGERSDLE